MLLLLVLMLQLFLCCVLVTVAATDRDVERGFIDGCGVRSGGGGSGVVVGGDGAVLDCMRNYVHIHLKRNDVCVSTRTYKQAQIEQT